MVYFKCQISGRINPEIRRLSFGNSSSPSPHKKARYPLASSLVILLHYAKVRVAIITERDLRHYVQALCTKIIAVWKAELIKMAGFQVPISIGLSQI